MFSSLATKIALKKAGISSDSFKLPWDDASKKSSPPFDTNDDKSAWPAWMNVKNLPLTVQPWLTPIPPPVAVSPLPQIGQPAPLDRDRELTFGNGKRTIVVFLRCVGCACTSSHSPPSGLPSSPLTPRILVAQKTFLQLRAIATRFPSDLTCLAVSHSSAAATQKWITLLGGAWNVTVVIDEDRAVYAAWGLGLGSVWYVLNPTSTVAGFKEKGWLGASVAGSLQRSGGAGKASISTGNGAGVVGSDLEGEGPATVMGNKWQESGAWAVDGRGRVVWGGKAARADDVVDLEGGVKALGL